jgi:hypothetical protein
MGKDRHLFFQILTLAFRALRFAAPHDQDLKFFAAGTADKIK